VGGNVHLRIVNLPSSVSKTLHVAVATIILSSAVAVVEIIRPVSDIIIKLFVAPATAEHRAVAV